ncbi:hypothetical protein BC830DRAFT_143003 [Chytriomyces sp. MP71]|nr:hypothetical protein BC830DRAFT_143003 [Chytriomyces sp. MP71]
MIKSGGCYHLGLAPYVWIAKLAVVQSRRRSAPKILPRLIIPTLSSFLHVLHVAFCASLFAAPRSELKCLPLFNSNELNSDERSFRPPRNRASSGSIPVDSPPIPTPQSHTRTPPIATTPAKHDSVPTPRRPSTASSTNSKKSVASQGVPTPVNPLPPQSLAWTDIIRTRYPHFQRSTVQTSKHAREFIESRGIPFFRVTPTHSLGRSKPTYAIPPHIHKEFLDYFEDKFGTEGAVLGRRRVGGDRTPGDPGYDDARAAVEGNGWGGVWKETGNAEDGIEAGPVSSCVGKRKASLAGASVTESTASKRRLSSQDGMEEGVKTEGPIAVTTPAVLEKITVDATAFPTADGSKSKKTSSSKSVSKSGLVLTRYNRLVFLSPCH